MRNPLLDVAFEVGRRAFALRRDRAGKVGYLLLHDRIVERLVEGAREPGDHGLWRSLGRPQAAPDAHFELRKTTRI